MSIDEYARVSSSGGLLQSATAPHAANAQNAVAKCHCTLLSTVEVTEEEEKALILLLPKLRYHIVAFML